MEAIYKRLCEEPSDINEHLPILRQYARPITEEATAETPDIKFEALS